jgi:hypothetical protein
MNKLYQIGMPVEYLSTVFMLWSSYERPCKIVVSPAKTEDWAVIELRDTELTAAITETVKECQVKVVGQDVKIIRL